MSDRPSDKATRQIQQRQMDKAYEFARISTRSLSASPLSHWRNDGQKRIGVEAS